MSATRARVSAKNMAGAFDAATFGACLKERRLAKAMTLQDLSDQTGFSVSALSEMENGQKATFQKAAGVCVALGVRLSRVLLDAERSVMTAASAVSSGRGKEGNR